MTKVGDAVFIVFVGFALMCIIRASAQIRANGVPTFFFGSLQAL